MTVSHCGPWPPALDLPGGANVTADPGPTVGYGLCTRVHSLYFAPRDDRWGCLKVLSGSVVLLGGCVRDWRVAECARIEVTN